jgi:hypothetical protein
MKSPSTRAALISLGLLCAGLLFVFCLTSCGSNKNNSDKNQNNSDTHNDDTHNDDTQSGLETLAAAYPGAFEIIPNGIRFPDGTIIVYNDGEDKDFDTKLTNPDLRDMLSLSYPQGEQKSPPPENYDPGRFRPDAFFRALYGKTEAEIRSKFRSVRWMPSTDGSWLPVSTCFGVDKKLEAVIAELEALGPEFTKYLSPSGGSFNYRTIVGTERLSPHSFGIAVDIAVDFSNYWLWEKKGAAEYKNSIPYEIVDIFEKHGFIWGGKWYHFDTMHFEYRPELLIRD